MGLFCYIHTNVVLNIKNNKNEIIILIIYNIILQVIVRVDHHQSRRHSFKCNVQVTDDYRPAGNGQRTVTNEYRPIDRQRSTHCYRRIQALHRQTTLNTDLNSPDRNVLDSILSCLIHISTSFPFQNAHEKIHCKTTLTPTENL